jgi:hypothetical protein
MASVSDKTRQDRVYKTARLCLLRGKGTISEDEIAEHLDFRESLGAYSARTMYEELESWGLPEWLVYPPTQQHGPIKDRRDLRRSNARRVARAMWKRCLPRRRHLDCSARTSSASPIT